MSPAPHDAAPPSENESGPGADGPLVGTVVIDLTRALAGPHAAMMLGDLGARVIKVETPGTGDDTRGWGPPFVDGDGGDTQSTYFLSCNRSKESIAIDLKSADGRDLLEAMLRKADVLMENFRPGTLDRLGFPTSRLIELNSQLVVLSVSGFGHDGPEGGRAGYDQIAQGDLLVPFSYVLGPEAAIIMMIGVYVATSTAGGIAGSLFNMPGDVMGAATARDGYPMTGKGEAGRAISMQIFASAIGGIIGVVLLVLIAPQFLRIALEFGSPEFFALAILGLACVAALSEGSLVKALLSAVIGLLIATVGFDAVSGAARFTFGNQSLQGGIDFIPAIIGFFAVSEILHILYTRGTMESYSSEEIKKIPRVALPSLKDIKYVRFTILRSALVGNFVGMLPGAGSTIAAFLAYGTERQTAKNPGDFGKGEIKGVAAPESANNSAAAGSMLPLITLGIPGGAVTAIMLGVFILNGLRPGPLLFERTPEIATSIYGAFFMAAVLVLVIGLLSVRMLLRLLTVPFEFFSTMVLLFAVVGTFALYNRPLDLWVMLGCGVLGFFAKRYNFSISALILGLVLGDIAEVGLVNGIGVTRGDWTEFFTRPFTMGTLIAALLLMVLPFIIAKLLPNKDTVDDPDDGTSPTAGQSSSVRK